MEFTPIETQEQFDAMVKDRVDRAKKSAAKEFETQLKDLESIKEQLTSKDAEVEALKAKISDFESEKKANEESYQGMQKELSELKLKALKTRIAHELHVGAFADDLKGDDEESIRESAKEYAEKAEATHKANSKTVMPSYKHEEVPMNQKDEAYKELAQFFGKEK